MDITLFHRDDSKLGAYKSFFASFFADPHHHPDLIVKVEDEWFGRANAVDKELFEHYEMAISTAEFSIWKRRD
jgi:hypothetical protein